MGITIKKKIDFAFGVIQRVDLDITNEEIIEVIKSDKNVVSIKLLSKKGKNGQLTPKTTVSREICGERDPSPRFFYGVKFGVEHYIFRFMQCYCFWRHGHIAQNCSKNN